jgi:hypothetical protein
MKPNENRPRSNMKKFITIFISCSLALSAGAMAQQDEAQPTPKKKQQEKAHAPREPQSPAHPQGERPANRPNPGMKAKEPVTAPPHPRAHVPAKESANATPNVNAQTGQQHKKGRNASKAPPTANEAANPAPAATSPQAAPLANKPNPAAQKPTAQTKKLDTQAVQKIKSEHANFQAQPKPEQVPAVTFSQSRTISGSEQWQGQNYVAFRSYRPQMHDQNFYRSHYSRVELIGGGYYYFNAGYWYPAWGYQPSAQYYVYDGPIYAGRSAERLDRVIADVQAGLQEQGYYKGEVDGLLGPLTREALTGYQSDHGLYTTAAIDEPTLNSLGMD